MLERLLEYEREFFFAINGSHTRWLDHIMFAFASPWAWLPPVLAVLFFVLKRREDRVLMLVGTVSATAGSVLVTEVLVKPFFMRFRPTNHPDFMDSVRVLNDYVADGAYGFISGHSASAFAFAVASALIMKNMWYSLIIFLWAVIMVYSRVYLAAHFITDVIPGLLVGALIGWLTYKGVRLFLSKGGVPKSKI